jgi:general secretion pathway protein K
LLRRPLQGYANVAAFWNVSGLTASPEAGAQTAVTSTWFSLQVDVKLGGADLEEHGLIDARQNPARLAARQWGERS